MKRITKKEFINTLETNASVFIGSYFNADIDYIMEALNSASINFDAMDTRTVTAVTSTALLFSDGSRLTLNQYGKNVYYEYTVSGLVCLIQDHCVYDDFDGCDRHNMVIYAIKAATVAA